jgi:hypothetical protein
MRLLGVLYFALELRGTTVAITEVIENQQESQKEIEELDDSPSSSLAWVPSPRVLRQT